MINSVLSSFSESLQPCQFSELGNAGGFSGAQIWRGSSPVGDICVRQWPRAHPQMDQLRWMHTILLGVEKEGCRFVPAPILNNEGETIIRLAGSLWEVTPWKPGIADLRAEYTAQKLALACQSLAQFHLAAVKVSEQSASSHLAPALAAKARLDQPSPGIGERFASVHRQIKDLRRYRDAVQRMADEQIRAKLGEILDLAEPRLRQLAVEMLPVQQLRLPLQPCIRDIWHQHVLFEDNRLTGIVDYGAMRVDSVALDLARLIGSLQLCHVDVWKTGTSAYESIRPLSASEWQTMQMGARSGAVLAGLNWIRWLALENRTFENMDHVQERISEILGQLRTSMPFFNKNEM